MRKRTWNGVAVPRLILTLLLGGVALMGVYGAVAELFMGRLAKAVWVSLLLVAPYVFTMWVIWLPLPNEE